MLRRSLKDAAIALSLANLFFIGAWIPILDASYDWPNKFDDLALNNIVALILDVLLLAGAFFLLMTLARRSGNKLVLRLLRWAFVFVLLGILGIAFFSQFPEFSLSRFALLRITYFNITELRILGAVLLLLCALATMRRYRWLIAALGGLAVFLLPLGELQLAGLVATIIVTCALIRWHGSVVTVAAGVALIFFPLFLLTLFQSLTTLSKLANVPNAPPAARIAQPAPRVVWIIFDEMDYSLSFAKRPSTLVLPEFDRLRDRSLYAANAYPPADYTLVSMPALISGKLVTRAQPVSPSEVMLSFEGTTEAVPWSAQPNIFSRSLELGLNTGLVGWYHPYQRIIGKNLTFSFVRSTRDLSLPKEMLLHLEQPMKAAAFDGSARKLEGWKTQWDRETFLALYKDIREEAKRAAANSDLGLVLIHYPIPHPPGIYRRDTQEFTADGESSYLDGLALADRTLGEVRSAMEQASLWNSSFILVSSDHWWRPYVWQGSSSWSPLDDEFVPAKEEINHRVPFLLKAPGQASELVYDSPFNTALTHDLLLSILRGEVSDATSAARWIDQHRSIAESPYGYEKSRQR